MEKKISLHDVIWLFIGTSCIGFGLLTYILSVIKNEHYFLEDGIFLFLIVPLCLLGFFISIKKLSGVFPFSLENYGVLPNTMRNISMFIFLFTLLVYKYVSGVYQGSNFEGCYEHAYPHSFPLQQYFIFSPWWMIGVFLLVFVKCNAHKKIVKILDILWYISLIYSTSVSLFVFWSLSNVVGCS